VKNAHELAGLRAGVPIPEFGAVIPWGVTEAELFALVPQAALTRSPGGWPLLRFRFLGVEGQFAFNFVTHPKGRLIEVALASGDPRLPGDERPLYREFTRISRLLHRDLGKPNWIDVPKSHHRRWGDWELWVDLAVDRGYYALLGGEFFALSLSAYAKFALPENRP
jgi:hypothetical protein